MNYFCMYPQRKFGLLSICCKLFSLFCYRHYVISHWPNLGYLDDSAVGQEERAESQKIYGRRRAKVSSIAHSGVPPHVREGEGEEGEEGEKDMFVAQLIERSPRLQSVVGSNPARGRSSSFL